MSVENTTDSSTGSSMLEDITSALTHDNEVHHTNRRIPQEGETTAMS